MYQSAQSSQVYVSLPAHAELASAYAVASSDTIHCNWKHFRAQMLLQWKKLTVSDLEEAGPNCCHIARLIERKYGIAADLVENYLRSFERTVFSIHSTHM